MTNPIEADPDCGVVVEFSKEYNGKVGAAGIRQCPIIDKTDPDHPKALCVISVLRDMGATKIKVLEGVCPKGIKGLKSDRASKN